MSHLDSGATWEEKKLKAVQRTYVTDFVMVVNCWILWNTALTFTELVGAKSCKKKRTHVGGCLIERFLMTFCKGNKCWYWRIDHPLKETLEVSWTVNRSKMGLKHCWILYSDKQENVTDVSSWHGRTEESNEGGRIGCKRTKEWRLWRIK